MTQNNISKIVYCYECKYGTEPEIVDKEYPIHCFMYDVNRSENDFCSRGKRDKNITQKSPYQVLDIAKYIVTKCIEDQKYITNLQLNEIMYIIQRDYLQKKGITLFDDLFEAWRCGPILTEVYYFFCGAGAMPLTDTYKSENIIIAPEHKKRINKIIANTRELDPWDMMVLVNNKDSAWKRTFDTFGNRSLIPNEMIKIYG